MVPQPKAIVEVISFNGDGTLTVPGVTASINGVILQPPPGTGEYTVAADCTGTITFHGAPPGAQRPRMTFTWPLDVTPRHRG